jgi:large subunit ribosomal protein L25
MRETLQLTAEPRTKLGKGPSYQSRKSGRIPGVVYGGKADPETVQVDERTLTRHYNSGSFLQTLVMLESGGKKTRVIPRAVQLDPVTDRVVHVDFMRLTAGGTISLDIPVHFHGQEVSPGIKKGGVLNIVRHEVALLCPVDNIPEFIEADLSELDIGDSVHISAFKLPEGVKPVIRGRDFTVATIAPPTTYTEEATTIAAAAPGAEGAAPAEGAEGAAPAAGGAAAPAAGDKGKAPAKK